MSIPVERILPGKCYKVRESAPRRVLLIQDKRVTFILRGDMTWTVARYQQDVESFARGVEGEIDCMTLADLTENQAS